MQLSIEELKSIYYGGYRFEETDDGYLHAHHYSPEQIEYFRSISEIWYYRSLSNAGKTLDFITEATELSFEYKLLWIGTIDTIEIMIDGVIKRVFHEDEISDMGKISYTMASGKKRVVIYLPADAQILIRNFEINAPVENVVKGEKVLWMGDSITQGYGPYRSSHTYVNVANRILNYNVVNQGLGGYRYDKGSLMDLDGFYPDKIITAFGTNQYMTDGRECVEEYYRKLSELYPDVPVISITPLYRIETPEKLAKLVEFSDIIKEVCSSYDNITVIDGFSLMGHTQDYLHDAVHPNALGCEMYGRNLADIIIKENL